MFLQIVRRMLFEAVGASAWPPFAPIATTGGFKEPKPASKFDNTIYHVDQMDIGRRNVWEYVKYKVPVAFIRQVQYATRYLFDRQDIELADATTMFQLIDENVFSRYVETRDGATYLDLRFLTKLDMAPAFIYLDMDSKRAYPVSAEMLARTGQEVLPERTESPSEHDFESCQMALFLAGPSHFHSFVHFHGPTALAVFAETECPDGELKDVLQLISRYVTIYNFGGIDLATEFVRSLAPAHTGWNDAVIARTQGYWRIQKRNPDKEERCEILGGEGYFRHQWVPAEREDFEFSALMQRYYEVISTKIRSLQFNPEHLNLFREFVHESIHPVDSTVETLDVLTFFVWNNSACHSLDHRRFWTFRHMALLGPRKFSARYRYFMNSYTQPYGSLRDEKLSQLVPEIQGLKDAVHCYVSIQF
ncbi:MAG: hypothetical protein ACI9MC_001254 [Kiritimatiellia bacterium]